MNSGDIVVQVEGVSKKYCKSLRKSMVYGVQDIFRNALGLSSRSQALRPGEFWAADDVSFDLRRGEVLGLIGPNGSGKTTLLKLLSGIFWPDRGRITVRGRLGALIEVGAGFHPALTGRENIYVNAAILGMSRKETDERFDAIVEFSDIGDFIGTPVKYYSSGMYVRLGFAIAAHCRPDILLIDEVLAVGDEYFQTKCLRKIKELIDDSCTVVLVSHNLDTIRTICDRAVFLHQGRVGGIGDPRTVVGTYRDVYLKKKVEAVAELRHAAERDADTHNEAVIAGVRFLDRHGNEVSEISTGDHLRVEISCLFNAGISAPNFTMGFYGADGILYFATNARLNGLTIEHIGKGEEKITVDFPEMNLMSNVYELSVSIADARGFSAYDWHQKRYTLFVKESKKTQGKVYMAHQWSRKTV